MRWLILAAIVLAGIIMGIASALPNDNFYHENFPEE